MVFFLNNSLSYLSAYPFSYKIHVFNFAERDHSTDGFSLSPSFPPFPLFFCFSFPPFLSLSLSYIYLFVMWTFLKKLFTYFWLGLVFCCCTSFSLAVASEGYSLVLVRSAYFSLRRLLAVEHGLRHSGFQWLQHVGSVVVAPGL